MTVETTTRKQNFAGGQSALAYTFRARTTAPSDIKVDLTAGGTSSTLTYTNDYTVTVASDGIGGTVHVSPSYSTDFTYTVYRETTNTQTSDYDDYNQFPADTLEASIDQTTMINQEQAEEIARSVKLPVSTTLSNITVAISASGVIGWDAAGTGLTNYPNPIASVTNASNYATSAATSATAAANSATTASTQATLAGNYATSASTSATLAGNYATSLSTVTLQSVCNNGDTYTNATTAGGMTISQTGVLGVAQNALFVTSGANQTGSSAHLVSFTLTSTASTQKVFDIVNNGGGVAMGITNNKATSSSQALVITNAGTGHGLDIEQDGVLASGKNALYVYSNAVQNQSNVALAYVCMDNASSTKDAFFVKNDGTGHGIYCNQEGVNASNFHGLYIYSEAVQANSPLAKFEMNNASAAQPVVYVDNNGTADGVWINQDGTLGSGEYALYVYSGTAQTNEGLAMFYHNNPSTSAPCVRVYNEYAGPHFRLEGDPNVASPTDGDLWFDGTNLKIRIGSTTYNIDKTAV